MKMVRDSQMLLWWTMLTNEEKDTILDAIQFILMSPNRYKAMVETTITAADQLTGCGSNDPTA
jgi:hypothetical protein